MGDGVDQWIEIERREVGIFRFDEYDVGRMVPGEVNFERVGIVQVWKSDAILGTNGLTNDDFVDIVEFIPIFVARRTRGRLVRKEGRRKCLLSIDVFDERFEFRTAGSGHI